MLTCTCSSVTRGASGALRPGKVGTVTVVVLTGATRGIGRAAAIELVRRGADVALVGRDPERVSLVAEEADLEDLQSQRSYSPRVYGVSKLCNILFTRELARRAPELRANCFHPGVVRTGFAKYESGIWKALATLGAPFFRSPERGARSLVWLALSDDAAALTGEYIMDEKVVAPSAQARDDNLARSLWERSAELVSLPNAASG